MTLSSEQGPTTVEQPTASLFDTLPPLQGAWPEGQPARKKSGEHRGFDRRGFVKRVVGTGMALGLSSLTVFPPARAFADGFDIYNSCPSYAADHGCSPGCGPSVVRNAACDSRGWHENTGCFYKSRYNQCYGGWADGWYWRPSGCSPCGSARTSYRCHDGRTCPDNCGNCYYTICRSFQGCS